MDEWTQQSKEDHEKQVMEKRIYREDMENGVRDMMRDIFTEALENAERNGQQMKEDDEKSRIAHEAELMAEIAALQVVMAGMAAKDAEVVAMQEETRAKNEEAESRLKKCDTLITGLRNKTAERKMEMKQMQDKLSRNAAQEGGHN